MRRATGGLPAAVLFLAGLGVLAFAVHLDPIGLVLVALAVVAVVATAAGPRGRDAEQPGDVHGRLLPGADHHALDVAQWRLTGQLADPEQVEASLRPRLTALVADRLARRGTELTDPGAPALLGEPLWTFLTGPPITRRVPVREFETLLTRVESL